MCLCSALICCCAVFHRVGLALNIFQVAEGSVSGSVTDEHGEEDSP